MKMTSKKTAKKAKKVLEPATGVGCCRTPEEMALDLKKHFRTQLAFDFYKMRLQAALSPDLPGIADQPGFSNINAQRAVRDADQLLSMLDMPFGAFNLGEACEQAPPTSGPMNHPTTPKTEM